MVHIATLAELAPRYGFWYVNRRLERLSAKAAPAYLSAYFVTGKRGKTGLQESVLAAGMPRSIVHISTELTQRTVVTMRELRFRRFVWARWGGFVRASYVDAARRLALMEREQRCELAPHEVGNVLLAELPRRRGP